MAENKMGFDEAIEKLESLLDEVEAGNLEDSVVEAKLAEAEQLKDYCQNLLEKERESIIKMAEENGISLDDLGLDEEEEEDEE